MGQVHPKGVRHMADGTASDIAEHRATHDARSAAYRAALGAQLEVMTIWLRRLDGLAGLAADLPLAQKAARHLRGTVSETRRSLQQQLAVIEGGVHDEDANG